MIIKFIIETYNHMNLFFYPLRSVPTLYNNLPMILLVINDFMLLKWLLLVPDTLNKYGRVTTDKLTTP